MAPRFWTGFFVCYNFGFLFGEIQFCINYWSHQISIKEGFYNYYLMWALVDEKLHFIKLIERIILLNLEYKIFELTKDRIMHYWNQLIHQNLWGDIDKYFFTKFHANWWKLFLIILQNSEKKITDLTKFRRNKIPTKRTASFFFCPTGTLY